MNHLEAVHHLLSLLPLQLFAGGLIPALQFAREKFRSLQVAQRKLHLRSRVVALNAFISSAQDIPAGNESRAVCLDDAMAERDNVLKELASSIALETARQEPVRPRRWLPWLLLLYQPPQPIGWVLRWTFFALIFVTLAGSVRGVLHENYLPPRVLVPFLITSFVLAVVVRLAALHIEGVRPRAA